MLFYLFLAHAMQLRAPQQWRTRCQHQPGQALRCNVIYLKIYKTGSSTAGGVARRIAARNGLHGVRSDWDQYSAMMEPAVAANHAPMYAMYPQIQSMHLPSFIFTMVRDPVARCFSQFYHGHVYMRDVPNTAANKIDFLRACKNMQVDYMSTQYSGRKFNKGCTEPGRFGSRDVAGVMAFYDFVGVTDDFDTSMAVLAARLNVRQTDVLFLSSKVSGEHAQTPVSHPPLHEEPASVQAFVRNEFRKNNYDFDLWAAAKQKLYAEADGVNVARFKSLLTRATRKCEGTARFPLTETGTVYGCYWGDNGCGYPCLDSFSASIVNASFVNVSHH